MRCSIVLVVALAPSLSFAQPAAGPLGTLFDAYGIPDSRDGDVPVRTWVLEGHEFGGLGGGLRGCASYRVVGTTPEGDSPSGVAFGPDGSWFVAAHRASRNLLVYDSSSRALLREIPLSGSPADLAVSADGRWAVTPNLFEDTASIVDLDAGLEVAVVPVGAGPICARITPDGTRALVGSLAGNDLSIIDIAGGAELHRIADMNFGVVLSANGESWAVGFEASNPIELATDGVALFPSTFTDQLGFVDIDAGTVAYVGTADAPRNVGLSADGSVAVVTHAFGNDNVVSVVDVPGGAVTKTINIGTRVWGPVALDPSGASAAVAVQNAVRMVDLVSDAVGPDLNTASVNRLLRTADGLHALAVGFRGALISFSSGTVVTQLNNVVSTTYGAVSPADHRAVMLATTFGEDMVVVNTDGASGFLEEVRPSGPPPEGDKPRTVAVSPDGSRVLVVNQFSRNVSVFDAGMQQLGLVGTGLRPGQVRVSPDGSRAVVANRDDPFVTVIDIAGLTASEVAISTRGDQVAISPDGVYAYVAVVTSDGVWRVNLDTLSVEGAKLPVGEMGGVGYTGGQFSGMTLSPDGTTLVACNSFDNTVTVIDAAAWAVEATVAVGTFPTAATFSPDSSRVYVTNRNDDTVSVVTEAGGTWGEDGLIAVGDFPYLSVVSDDGGTLYVMNTGDDEIGVVDTFLFSQTGTVALDETPVGLVLDDARGRLYVGVGTASASTNGEMTQLGRLHVIDTSAGVVVETLCADHFISEIASDAGRGLVAGAGLGGESAVFFDLDPCDADVNGDGLVDTRDFIAFLGLWSAGDPRADWNGDGVVNTQDFIAFLGEWAAGC